MTITISKMDSTLFRALSAKLWALRKRVDRVSTKIKMKAQSIWEPWEAKICMAMSNWMDLIKSRTGVFRWDRIPRRTCGRGMDAKQSMSKGMRL